MQDEDRPSCVLLIFFRKVLLSFRRRDLRTYASVRHPLARSLARPLGSASAGGAVNYLLACSVYTVVVLLRTTPYKEGAGEEKRRRRRRNIHFPYSNFHREKVGLCQPQAQYYTVRVCVCVCVCFYTRPLDALKGAAITCVKFKLEVIRITSYSTRYIMWLLQQESDTSYRWPDMTR